MTDFPTPGQAVRIWRKWEPRSRIPELKTQTAVVHQGWGWIGLYADKRLIGILTDRQGAWAPVKVGVVEHYEPEVLAKLKEAYK